MRDRVARGLVAGDRDQEEEQVEVHLGETVAVDFGVEQRRHDVVARHLPAFGRDLVRVHEHLDLRVLHFFFGDDVLGVFAPDHPVAPLEQLVPVFLGNAEHLGDHLEGELGGDVDHEVGGALLDHLVEDPVGLLADAVLEGADLPGGEAAVDQLAVARVLGRVHREHEVAPLLEVVRDRLLEHHDPAALLVGGVRRAVAAYGDHVGVLGDDPEAGAVGLRMLVYRRLVPEEREPLVRDALGEAVAVEQVDVGELHGYPSGAGDVATLVRCPATGFPSTSRSRNSTRGMTSAASPSICAHVERCHARHVHPQIQRVGARDRRGIDETGRDFGRVGCRGHLGRAPMGGRAAGRVAAVGVELPCRLPGGRLTDPGPPDQDARTGATGVAIRVDELAAANRCGQRVEHEADARRRGAPGRGRARRRAQDRYRMFTATRDRGITAEGPGVAAPEHARDGLERGGSNAR